LLSALFLCPLISQTPGSVEGVVVDSRTGIPLPGVSVYFGSDKGPQYNTETDPSGQFRIAGMASGDYGCHFEKSGYISQYSGNQNSPLKAVHIVASQEPVRLTVSLATYAKLRGRVLDPEGKAVARAKVTLAPLEETTDEQGRFSFSQINPGSYTLKGAPPRGAMTLTAGGFAKEPESPKAAPPGTERTELLPTWYPSFTAADLAEPVIVRSGEDLSGLDIRLQSMPVYRVRGRVFNLDGSPAKLAVISSFSQADLTTLVTGIVGGKSGAGDRLGYFTLSRNSQPAPGDGQDGIVRDGAFELQSVPRGVRQFRITAMADPEQVREQIRKSQEGVPGGTRAPLAAVMTPAATIVSVVVDHDIDDLEIRATPPAGVDVTIELSNTSSDKTPDAVRNAAVTFNGQATSAMVSARRRTDNTFRIDNLAPGELEVAAAPGVTGGYYLASVGTGGQDVTWRPFNVQAGSPAIRITYKPNGGTVTGTVESDLAKTVVLIPQGEIDAIDVQYGRATPIGAGGGFEIDSIAPGSYYAFAVDQLAPERLRNPAVARRIAAEAALVHVTEGAAVSVKLQLVHLDN
jgi:hypothetical protein